MKCYVEFGLTADIIEIPNPVARKIDKYRNDFLDWIYDRNNSHKYWVKVKDGKGGWYDAVCYDTDAFVDWLNENVINDKMEPATIVKRDVGINNCPKGMLRIFF